MVSGSDQFVHGVEDHACRMDSVVLTTVSDEGSVLMKDTPGLDLLAFVIQLILERVERDSGLVDLRALDIISCNSTK